MENGLSAQLMNSVTPMPRQWALTCRSAEKSMRMSMGMIISHTSTATGRLTLATSIAPMSWNAPGKKCPNAMPTTMHRATHSVR